MRHSEHQARFNGAIETQATVCIGFLDRAHIIGTAELYHDRGKGKVFGIELVNVNTDQPCLLSSSREAVDLLDDALGWIGFRDDETFLSRNKMVGFEYFEGQGRVDQNLCRAIGMEAAMVASD